LHGFESCLSQTRDRRALNPHWHMGVAYYRRGSYGLRHCHRSFTFHKLDQPHRKRGDVVREVCCCNCRALQDANAPPHIVRAVAEACASVNARFPLRRFYDIAVGEILRQTIIEYHSKDDDGE
jgi:hypothetical protein